jgi:7-cyano-7-deazaguanine reductase
MEAKKFKKKLKSAAKNPDTVVNTMIELVDYEYQGKRDVEIVIEHREFTSLCPRTGLPDFGTIIIRYTPKKKIMELRSLKFYFLQFRYVGIFYEHVVNKILDDLASLIDPLTMEITGQFNIRGGIATTTKAVYAGQYMVFKATPRTQTEGPDPRD